MSQDDLLKPDALELLVKRQKETKADAVFRLLSFITKGMFHAVQTKELREMSPWN
jgi:hypothetical protein